MNQLVVNTQTQKTELIENTVIFFLFCSVHKDTGNRSYIFITQYSETDADNSRTSVSSPFPN